MVSTVPERVMVCVGSVRVCAQLGIERAKTTNPAALRIAFTRFMHLSLCCRIDLFGAGNFLTGARLNRRFPRRLCKNRKISRVGETRFRSALKSGRWCLAKCRPISPSEASQLRETETMCDICDVDHVRIGIAQHATDLFQPAQQH